MQPRYYAGIGSRKTPRDVELTIRFVAQKLGAHGFILNSGAAEGADAMFESHAPQAQIFLPWKGFMGHASVLCEPSSRAFEIAAEIHPAWNKLTSGGRRLHARNVHQVLGKDLVTPIEFVVCWTPGGKVVGGTSTAIRLAERIAAPVVNLFDYPPMLMPSLDARLDQLIAGHTA